MFWRIYWVAIVVVMLSTAVIPRLWYQRSAKRPARRHPRRRPTERQELVVDRTVDQVRTAVFEAMRLTKIRVVPSSSPEAIRG